MNLSTLFTANGFTSALQEYHKHLYAQYNFPQLTGMKPAHKMAEVFGYKSAEPFLAALEKSNVTQNESFGVSVMLFNGQPQIVHIEYEESDSTARVMFENQAAYMLITIDPDALATPYTHYLSNDEVIVYFGQSCIHLKAETDGVGTDFYESNSGEKLTPAIALKTSHDVDLIETAFELYEDQPEDQEQAKPPQTKTVFIAVEKQDSRIYTTLHDTYPDALAHFINEIKEGIDGVTDYRSIAKAINLDGSATWTEEAAEENVDAHMKNMTERQLEQIYLIIHDADILLQINSATINV